MPARSIGSGTLSFGLVSIPIRVYVATHSEQLSFNLLHAPCGTRIKQQLYCPHHAQVVARSELEMARKLVQQLSSKAFRPEQYKDQYRERVQEVVQKKVAGEEVTAAEPEKPKAQVIDLMEALKASLSRTAARAERVAEPEVAGKRRSAARARAHERPVATRRAHKK